MKEFFLGFKEGFRDFGCNIQTTVNLFLFSFVYFFGVGITSMIARMLKKGFLETEILEEKDTYWSDLNLKKKNIDDYYRQF